MDALTKKRWGWKPSEEAEPELKSNGEPCKNSDEKLGEDTDKPCGRTRQGNDWGRKILTRKGGEQAKWSRFANSLKE